MLMTVNRTLSILLVAVIACLVLFTPPFLERKDSANIPRETLPATTASTALGPSRYSAAASLASVDFDPPLPAAKDKSQQSSNATDGQQLHDWPQLLYPQLAQIEALADSAPEQALVELVPMLSDADPVIRLAVLESLIDINHRSLLPTLNSAVDDRNPQVRILALQAMGLQRDSIAISSIEPYLFDRESDVRLAAIEALSNLEHEAAAQALAGVIFDPDIKIRRQAINALGEIGGNTAILYLMQAQNDPDPDIRASASAILDEFSVVAEY